VAAVGILAAGLGLRWSVSHRVAHQRPYPWDRYVISTLKFEGVPWLEVVSKINAAVAKASKGVITQAVTFDTSPARIMKVNCPPACEPQADQLIKRFRAHEHEMNRRGANGFEGALCTGTVHEHHSIGCTLRMLAEESGLSYEEKADGIHLSRMPRQMECRAYRITDGLVERMKYERSKREYKVGAEPLVSALIHETGFGSWSIMLPEGPNRWTSETRYNEVFRFIPELNIILALATPEEHVQAEGRLKASGLWGDP